MQKIQISIGLNISLSPIPLHHFFKQFSGDTKNVFFVHPNIVIIRKKK